MDPHCEGAEREGERKGVKGRRRGNRAGAPFHYVFSRGEKKG